MHSASASVSRDGCEQARVEQCGATLPIGKLADPGILPIGENTRQRCRSASAVGARGVAGVGAVYIE